MVTILYEDNHLIAVLKPAGMLVQGDETGDKCLMDEVKAYLKETYGKPGNVFLGLLHRLDRPVSGIVLFAKTSKGASRLSEQFRMHRVVKIYHALVIGTPAASHARLTNYLSKNEETNVTTVYDAPHAGALEAILSYDVVEKRGTETLVRVTLETGRPHQIRAQLSHIGHPIVGDIKYGAPAPLSDRSIALSATELTFETATGGERRVVTIPFLY